MQKPLQMKAVKISNSLKLGELKLEERLLEPPKANEITIRIACSGVNAPDILQVRGQYFPTKENANWPGLEVSGEIIAIGEKVKNWRIGERIIALCNGGGYAEFVNVPATQVLPMPDGWEFAEGASIAETFFTIAQTLLMRSKIKKNIFVLIHGASGGIGGAAIQLSKFYEMRPIAVISSDEKAKYAKSLGAEFIINYKKEDFVARTLEITNTMGADRIIDIIGGDIFAKNIKASAKKADIILLGLLGGVKAEINLAPILLKNINIYGSTLGPQTSTSKANIAKFLKKQIWPALNSKIIKPPFIRKFNLNEAKKAHIAMGEKNHYGKIVLVSKFGHKYL